MTLTAPEIRVFFGLPQTGGDFFTIGHATKGRLDTGSPLAGDAGTRVDTDNYAVSIRRGRTRDLDEFDTGTATVALRNLERTYDSLHAMEGGYVDFPDSAGNRLSVPDAAALDISGDQTGVFRVALDDWTPAGWQGFGGKWTVGSQQSWWFGLAADGNLYYVYSTTGTTQALHPSGAWTPPSNGDWLWLAFTHDVDNGSAQNVVRFWRSDNGVAWTQVGSTSTVAGTVTRFTGSAGLFIGEIAGVQMNGKVSDVSIRNGIGVGGVVGGTEVFCLEPGDFPADTASSFSAYSGQTVTVHRSGSPDTTLFPLTGPYYGELTPGKRCQVQIYDQTIYDGTIADWNNDWSVNGDATATFSAVDGLGRLARKEFDEWTATAGQTAGSRLTDALNRGEVNFGINRDFDTGVSTLQGDLVSWGSNVLNYCQLVAFSDFGRFFDSRRGQLTFRDRHAHFGATVKATFRDDGTGIPVRHIATQTGSELLFNRVGVDREGGILQTVEDAASQDEYDISSLMLPGLLMDSDSQANDMAHFLIGQFKDPRTRISSLTIGVSSLSAANQALVASLDLAEVIRVVWTPRSIGSPIDQTLVIEGIAHDITKHQGHIMTLSLSVLTQQDVFTIEDPVFGRLDTGGVLAF